MRVSRIVLPALVLMFLGWAERSQTATLSFEGLSAEFCAEPYSCVEQMPLTDREAHNGLESGGRVEVTAVVAPDPEQEQRCSGAPVKVGTNSAEERLLVCAAAEQVLQTLRHCNLLLRRTLQIQATDVFKRPNADRLFGLFDARQETVFVPSYARIPSLVRGTPYEGIPQREFYKSLVIHEVVHGVMHQNVKRAMLSRAATEYPAYALQIESLSAEVRREFLASFDPQALNSNALFNDVVLAFDPFLFAARAYAHYKSVPDGCSRLAALLNGEPEFIAVILP